MDQNLLTLYNVTACLVNSSHHQVAHVYVALNAPTVRMSSSDALEDIRDGTSCLRAVVDLYGLRAMLTHLFEFNSTFYSGQLRWINAVDSWSLFLTLPPGTLPIGADECQKLVQQLLSELVVASFPGQGLQVVFNLDGRYNPKVAFH